MDTTYSVQDQSFQNSLERNVRPAHQLKSLTMQFIVGNTISIFRFLPFLFVSFSFGSTTYNFQIYRLEQNIFPMMGEGCQVGRRDYSRPIVAMAMRILRHAPILSVQKVRYLNPWQSID